MQDDSSYGETFPFWSREDAYYNKKHTLSHENRKDIQIEIRNKQERINRAKEETLKLEQVELSNDLLTQMT